MKTLAIIALLALLALQVPSVADERTIDPFAAPNAIAEASNEWVKFYGNRINTLGTNAVDVRESRAFKHFMDRTDELKRLVKPQYQ